MRHYKILIPLVLCTGIAGGAVYLMTRINDDPDSQATIASKWLPGNTYAKAGDAALLQGSTGWLGPTTTLAKLDATLARITGESLAESQLLTRETLLFTRNAMDFLATRHPSQNSLAAAASLTEQGRTLKSRIERLPETFPTQKKLKQTLKLWVQDWVSDKRDAEGLLVHFSKIAAANSAYDLDMGDAATALTRWKDSVARFNNRVQKLFGEEHCSPTVFNSETNRDAIWLKPDGVRPAAWYYLHGQLRRAEEKSTAYAWLPYRTDALPVAAPIIAAQGLIEARSTTFGIAGDPATHAKTKEAILAVIKSAPANTPEDTPLLRLLRGRSLFLEGLSEALSSYDGDFGRLRDAVKRLLPPEARLGAERDALAAWCDKRHAVRIDATELRVTAAKAAQIAKSLAELADSAPWEALRRDCKADEAEWPLLIAKPEYNSIHSVEDELALLRKRLERAPRPLLRRVTEDRKKTAEQLLADVKALCTADAMEVLPGALLRPGVPSDLPADSDEHRAITTLAERAAAYVKVRELEADPAAAPVAIHDAWVAFMTKKPEAPAVFEDDIRSTFNAPAAHHVELGRARFIAKSLRREHLRPLLADSPAKLTPSERRFGIEVIREFIATLTPEDAEPAALAALRDDFKKISRWRSELDEPTRARLYDPGIAPLISAASLVLEARAALLEKSPAEAPVLALAGDAAAGLKNTNPELADWRNATLRWMRGLQTLRTRIITGTTDAAAIAKAYETQLASTDGHSAPTPALAETVRAEAAPWSALRAAGTDTLALEAAWSEYAGKPGGDSPLHAAWSDACLYAIATHAPVFDGKVELAAALRKTAARLALLRNNAAASTLGETREKRLAQIQAVWEAQLSRQETLLQTAPNETSLQVNGPAANTINPAVNASLARIRTCTEHRLKVASDEAAWLAATSDGPGAQKWSLLRGTLAQAEAAAGETDATNPPTALEKTWLAAFRTRLKSTRDALTLDPAEWESADTLAKACVRSRAAMATWNTGATPTLAGLWTSRTLALETLSALVGRDLDALWKSPDDRAAFDHLEHPALLKWLSVSPKLAEDFQLFTNDLNHLPDILRTDSDIVEDPSSPLNFEPKNIERVFREIETKSHLTHRWITPKMNSLREESADAQSALATLRNYYGADDPAMAGKALEWVASQKKLLRHTTGLRRLMAAHISRADYFTQAKPYAVNIKAAYEDPNGFLGHEKLWKIGVTRNAFEESGGKFNGCINGTQVFKVKVDSVSMAFSKPKDNEGLWCYFQNISRTESSLVEPIVWRMGMPVKVEFLSDDTPPVSASVGERNLSDEEVLHPSIPARIGTNWAMQRLQDGAANYRQLVFQVVSPPFPWPNTKVLWNNIKFPKVAPSKMRLSRETSEALRDFENSSFVPPAAGSQ